MSVRQGAVYGRGQLTILTKTISLSSISLVLSHHTGISDVFGLAGSYSLASPDSVEEEQDHDLYPDTS